MIHCLTDDASLVALVRHVEVRYKEEMLAALFPSLHRFFSSEQLEEHQMKSKKKQHTPSITMTGNKKEQSAGGLGNRALLDKMDKLRELGISGKVPLPQVRLLCIKISRMILTLALDGCCW